MKNISILRHYNQIIYSKILFRVMNKALEQRLHGFKLLWIISTLRVFWIFYSCLGLFQGRKFFDFVTKVLLLFIESFLLKTESRCNVISCCAQSSQLMPLFVTTASELPKYLREIPQKFINKVTKDNSLAKRWHLEILKVIKLKFCIETLQTFF